MKKHTISFAVAGALCALLSQSALAAPDWSKVPKKDIHVFHPGVAPIEWVSGKGEHSGASGLKKGEACAGCHVEDGKLSLDTKRLVSKEMEPKGGPKVANYPVSMQAAFDATNLYVRLTFKAPAGGADHGDKDNEVKATVMFPDAKVAMGDQVAHRPEAEGQKQDGRKQRLPPPWHAIDPQPDKGGNRDQQRDRPGLEL